MSPYNKKEEMSEAPQVEELLKNLEFHNSIQSITNRIANASNLQEILLDIKEDIRRLFNIYILNIYLIDKEKNELYTLQGGGAETKEIRFPINNKTFAGYVAQRKKTIHIADAYNTRDIKKIHDALKFDDSMDEVTGITTGQILAAPVIYEGMILGVMEIMNSRNGQFIDDYQQIFLDEIEVSLARAFFTHLDFTRSNQKQSARLEKLIQEGFITSDQMNQAQKEAFLSKQDPAAILISRHQISRQAVGAALADYYDCPFTPYSDDLHVILGLLKGIEKSTLINGLWIPLKVLKGKIHVLVNDPLDQAKKREIEEMLETNFIQFEVALADDIVKLIERSYAEQEEEEALRRSAGQRAPEKLPAEEALATSSEAPENQPTSKIHHVTEKKTHVRQKTPVGELKIPAIDETLSPVIGQNDGLLSEPQTEPASQPDLLKEQTTSEKTVLSAKSKPSADPSPASESLVRIPVTPEKDIFPLLAEILFEASARLASGIHFEPDVRQGKVIVRFRMDGQCLTSRTLTPDEYERVLHDIKTLAGLDVQNRTSLQEGNLKIQRPSGDTLNLSAVLIPAQGSQEDTVLHLSAKAKLVPLELLGLSEENYDNLVNILRQPRGAIFAVGTADVDLTNMLHACLENINTPEKKIWTAEETLDIAQNGIRQVLVDRSKGLDYPRLLRSFLMADADVIMAGQVHDLETARLCMEASLQRRLVLSALRADDIAGAIEKCLDMGLNDFVFADGMLSMLAPQMIKALCPQCREKYHPGPEEYEELAQLYGKEAFDRLNSPYSDHFSLYRPKGCESCGQTGYQGRLCLCEIFVFTPKMKRMLRRKESVEAIYRTALADGMTTLLQDGISRVLKGQSDSRHVRLSCLR